ncbi:putative PLC-like phosphodiesterase [Vibrio nigripulchritudo SFn27]|uniref:Putative PLC-like phosphodiesterase n=1 Tax=Vibrio nigripulchritudo TaxID=28173 RepID=U4KCI3_9VIBR|nr:glycerophosphodiester phosphodiesterase family protein [Vibrio nigripulchritudo]CCN84442.1 putative PLC-like phosphodiesterase [Vibrio nigripulchritudo BLFn1]CCN86489.1 putative PLC-like phosphodiesterase [Vibrio nigripulchritudo SFn27]CCN97032.1 putative PLC-like phosphodiesterase [Vibrio nigripulchritudo ENn2]CCO41610.1 putative PLC-like phosphodiesterase [Vibrio nigripulchritudo SFn135]CCO54215.1 putative PLC-like phosphodiesterase [Vibrio nigripulchritudo Wn13]
MSFEFHVARKGKVLVNSHRGYCHLYPENTLPAFEGAYQEGTHSIELDVAMTSDNEIVVIHDHSVDRTSDGSGYVEQMDFSALRELDFGSWFDNKFLNTKIPTLEECIVWAMDRGVGLVVEVKQRKRQDEFIIQLHALLRSIPGSIGYIQLLAFDHVLLNKAKKVIPDLNIQVVTLARYNDQLNAVLASNADCVCIEYPHAHVDDLRAYKQAGLCVRMFLPTTSNGLTPTEHFNRHFGYDVHGEVVGWLREGLIDMISHDDIEMLKSLVLEAGLEPV